MAKNHLITGATGFVGAALVLELLQRSDATLYCLVRPRDRHDDVQARLEQSLRAAAIAYGLDAMIAEIPQRCVALKGDILEPYAGLKGIDIGCSIEEIWHAAASLKFEDKYRQEIDAHNIHGTRHMLELARLMNIPVFNYISTAYVAGSRHGVIAEQRAAVDTPVNNHYEASKIVAEHLVINSGLYSRILRPSIVIGHSRTLAATSFTGFYGFIRQIIEFNHQLISRGQNLSVPLQIRAEAATPMNLIPIDWVVQDALSISLADHDRNAQSGRIYHLTNHYAPSLETDMKLVCKQLGINPPAFTQDREALSLVEQLLDRKLQFYTSYFYNPKTFLRDNADAASGPMINDRRFNEQDVERHINWYLDKLVKTDQKTDVFTRAA